MVTARYPRAHCRGRVVEEAFSASDGLLSAAVSTVAWRLPQLGECGAWPGTTRRWTRSVRPGPRCRHRRPTSHAELRQPTANGPGFPFPVVDVTSWTLRSWPRRRAHRRATPSRERIAGDGARVLRSARPVIDRDRP
ncbi:MAG: hypothetical protein BGO98_38555 [Myxococcales bacterium 68-20]|nr:MAG: hypothetical protein BGO98_38555 [Myxococcales bacterium 68-20]